jgi:hypothetical protein
MGYPDIFSINVLIHAMTSDGGGLLFLFSPGMWIKRCPIVSFTALVDKLNN